MRGGLVTALAFSAAILSAAALTLPVIAQELLPEGPGRETTLNACSGCHGVEFFIGVPRPRMAWENTMLRMMNRGMKISSEDYGVVAYYLATYIGLSPPPALSDAAQSP
jgi:hypothetical protein